MERNGDFQTDTLPTLRIEAGWANNPMDKGGETFRGIARNFNPDWVGWAAIDAAKTDPRFPANVNVDLGLKTLARDFFRTNYWDAIHGSELPWRMAAVLFDMAINSCPPGNPKQAVRQAQASLNLCGAALLVDGDIGPRTVKACWDKGKDAVEEFLTARLMFYTDIMVKDPTQRVWARGWLRRIVDMADYALEG